MRNRGFLTSWLKELGKKVQTVEDVEKLNTSIYGIEKKQFPYMLCITNMLLHDLDMPAIYHDNSLLKNVLDYTDKDRFDVILMNPPYGGDEIEGITINFPANLRSSETADLFMVVILYRLKKNGRAAVILPDGFIFGTDGAKRNIKEKLMKECNLHTIVRLPPGVFAPYTLITTNVLFFDKTGPTKSTWIYRMDPPNGMKNFTKGKPMGLEHFDPVIEWWNDRKEIVYDEHPKAKEFSIDEIAASGYNLDLCKLPQEQEEMLSVDELISAYKAEIVKMNEAVKGVLVELESIHMRSE